MRHAAAKPLQAVGFHVNEVKRIITIKFESWEHLI